MRVRAHLRLRLRARACARLPVHLCVNPGWACDLGWPEPGGAGGVFGFRLPSSLALTGLAGRRLYIWAGFSAKAVQDCASRESEQRLADCEADAPGWSQLQRAAVPWLLAEVRAKRLKPRDLSVWLVVAGSADLSTGEAHVTCYDLMRDFNYSHWSHVSASLVRLQEVGALQRVAHGRYLVSPRLLRVGGPGRHRMWFAKWAELQADRERIEPAPQPRLVGAARASWLAKQQLQAQPA